jgi:alpha-1,2-mannosyltransferase
VHASPGGTFASSFPDGPSTLFGSEWLGRRLDVLRAVSRDVAAVGPLLAVVYLTWFALQHVFAYDFEQAFYPAARHVLAGASPFPPVTHAALSTGTAFVYPPFTAVLVAPLALLPLPVAAVLFTLLLTASAVLALYVLDVRDWRCYAAIFLWPPVLSGLQTANLTLLLALGAALVWRFRDRRVVAAAGTAVLLALKLFLWPLVVWLLATRRVVCGVQALAAAVVITFAAWAVIGFAGLTEYVPLLRLFSEIVERAGYTPLSIALKAGIGFDVARGLTLGIGVLLVATIVLLGRRRRDEEAFVAAIAASVLCSPVCWLHYYALFIVPLAILRPRYSALWLLPFVVIGAPAAADGASWWAGIVIATFAVLLARAAVKRGDGRLGRPTVRSLPAG